MPFGVFFLNKKRGRESRRVKEYTFLQKYLLFLVMKKTISLLFIFPLLFLTGCQEADFLDSQYNGDPQNTTYRIDGKEVVIVDGRAEQKTISDGMSTEKTTLFSDTTNGDFDGNGTEDTAVLLTQESGGSGTFFWVAVFDGERGSNAVFLGDRIAPQNVLFQDGEIIVNYVTRFPWESFAAAPSLGKSKYLVFENGILMEIHAVSELSQEEATLLAIDQWGECQNDCEKMTVQRLDGTDGVWFVEAIYEGMKDDSVASQKYIAMAHFVDGKWVLGKALHREYKCREGRGHTDFEESFCK
jgi:hypothetical protein